MIAVGTFSACRPGPIPKNPRNMKPLRSFGMHELDRHGPRLADPVAVATALRRPIRALLAPCRSGLAADIQFDEPLGGKSRHLARQLGV